MSETYVTYETCAPGETYERQTCEPGETYEKLERFRIRIRELHRRLDQVENVLRRAARDSADAGSHISAALDELSKLDERDKRNLT